MSDDLIPLAFTFIQTLFKTDYLPLHESVLLQ